MKTSCCGRRLHTAKKIWYPALKAGTVHLQIYTLETAGANRNLLQTDSIFVAWLIKCKSCLGRTDIFQQSAPQNCPWSIPAWGRYPKVRYIRQPLHLKISVLHWQHGWYLVVNLSLKSSLEKAEKAGRHGLNSTSDVSLPCYSVIFPSGCFSYFMTLMKKKKFKRMRIKNIIFKNMLLTFF